MVAGRSYVEVVAFPSLTDCCSLLLCWCYGFNYIDFYKPCGIQLKFDARKKCPSVAVDQIRVVVM